MKRQAIASGTIYLVIVRIFLGLAVGAASALVPAYMSEMAPANARGRLSGRFFDIFKFSLNLSSIFADTF